jgi:hypothetical protein
VLCAGDELLLVRLMSRTGPVIEQLSNGTAQELIGTIIMLMLHQSFLDVVVPWLQQVLIQRRKTFKILLEMAPKTHVLLTVTSDALKEQLYRWTCILPFSRDINQGIRGNKEKFRALRGNKKKFGAIFESFLFSFEFNIHEFDLDALL